MKVQRKFVISLLLFALLSTEACNKKKPTLPAQTQAPTIAEALPENIPEKPEAPPQEVVQPKAVALTPKKATNEPGKVSATNKKSTAPASVAASTPPPASAPSQPPPQNNQTVATLRPPHTTASETPEMTVAAAISTDLANKQKDDTAHMVDATENVLKNLTRQLSDEEKAMRTQIQSYLQQSRKATVDGDYERAYNLAKKAQVLADALNKQ